MKRDNFYIGQKLQVPIRHEEEWKTCEKYVVVTGINSQLDIVYYSLKVNDILDGILFSGMLFNEANEFIDS